MKDLERGVTTMHQRFGQLMEKVSQQAREITRLRGHNAVLVRLVEEMIESEPIRADENYYVRKLKEIRDAEDYSTL